MPTMEQHTITVPLADLCELVALAPMWALFLQDPSNLADDVDYTLSLVEKYLCRLSRSMLVEMVATCDKRTPTVLEYPVRWAQHRILLVAEIAKIDAAEAAPPAVTAPVLRLVPRL